MRKDRSKAAKRKGNRQLQVRLPPDHWVWTLEPAVRTQEVKKALEFYRQYRGLLEDIRIHLEDIKNMLASGGVSVQEKKMPDEDTRLMDTLEKFLDF